MLAVRGVLDSTIEDGAIQYTTYSMHDSYVSVHCLQQCTET